MTKGKKKRRKFIDWEKKAHKEKVFIVVLFFAILLLTFYIGHSVYTSFQEKDKTDFLNGAVILLTKEKSQLNLEIENLNDSIVLLTQQKDQLNTDNTNLALDLADLQDDYDALEEELAGVEDELEECNTPSP